MTLCAALRLLRTRNASIRLLSRPGRRVVWRVIMSRADGTLAMGVFATLEAAFAFLQPTTENPAHAQ